MVNSYFTEFRRSIDLNLSAFQRKNDWPSVVAVLGDWLIIGTCIAAYEYSGNLLIYLLSIPIISGRMMALAFLMHEAGHRNLFKNKQLNQWLSEVLLAWPVFMSMRKYRLIHAQHHRHLKTEQDTEAPLNRYTEYQFPQSKSTWYTTLLLDLSGIHFFYYSLKKFLNRSHAENSRINQPALSTGYKTLRITYYGTLVFCMVFFDYWFEFMLFWLVPYVTWFQLVIRLQVCSEHFGVSKSAGYQTRSLILNRAEKFFFFPHNKHYHTEHHIYPEVYFAQLKNLHDQLIKAPLYAQNMQVTHGISGLFKELTHGKS